MRPLQKSVPFRGEREREQAQPKKRHTAQGYAGVDAGPRGLILLKKRRN